MGFRTRIHRREVQYVVDHERRGFESSRPSAEFGQRAFSRFPFLDDLELVDVRTSDVRRGRILCVELISPNVVPLDHPPLLALSGQDCCGGNNTNRAKSAHLILLDHRARMLGLDRTVHGFYVLSIHWE